MTRESDTNYGKRGGAYPNLFDAHPPFQIDGNFGGTAGISEMLLQSQDGNIELLPAIPKQWKSGGSVKGLVARGGFVIDMVWKNKKITQLKVFSRIGGNCKISGPGIGEKELIKTQKNKFYKVN